MLVGEKDLRFADQYPNDGSPYVFFLLPKSHVPSIMTKGETIGANVQIITNLVNAKSPASLALKALPSVGPVKISLIGSGLRAVGRLPAFKTSTSSWFTSALAVKSPVIWPLLEDRAS